MDIQRIPFHQICCRLSNYNLLPNTNLYQRSHLFYQFANILHNIFLFEDLFAVSTTEIYFLFRHQSLKQNLDFPQQPILLMETYDQPLNSLSQHHTFH
ncbi:hypothetical protein BGX14_1203 [Fibrobacter sp. UWS1]|nr:hypothetical protein BGX14_1203 [Fibrobacter sp. UWS1]